MTFEFGRLDKYSGKLWPWVRLPEITGHDLAVFVAGFVGERLLPVIRGVTDLQAYLAFLLDDREPHPWFATNYLMRAAQVVATSAQLGVSQAEAKRFLQPYEDSITKVLHNIGSGAVTRADVYVDNLLSDWASRTE